MSFPETEVLCFSFPQERPKNEALAVITIDVAGNVKTQILRGERNLSEDVVKEIEKFSVQPGSANLMQVMEILAHGLAMTPAFTPNTPQRLYARLRHPFLDWKWRKAQGAMEKEGTEVLLCGKSLRHAIERIARDLKRAFRREDGKKVLLQAVTLDTEGAVLARSALNIWHDLKTDIAEEAVGWSKVLRIHVAGLRLSIAIRMRLAKLLAKLIRIAMNPLF